MYERAALMGELALANLAIGISNSISAPGGLTCWSRRF